MELMGEAGTGEQTGGRWDRQQQEKVNLTENQPCEGGTERAETDPDGRMYQGGLGITAVYAAIVVSGLASTFPRARGHTDLFLLPVKLLL